jgi:hypothetical protein
MGLYLEKAHLQRTPEASLEGKMEESPHSEVAVEPAATEHDNQAELERLRVEQKWLAGVYAAASAAVGSIFFVPALIVAIGGFLAGSVTGLAILQRTQKVSAILRAAEALIEAFKQQQIQIFPDVTAGERDRLDLWVRFPLPPKKAIFTISFRSNGKARLIYRESKEAFYVQAGRKGLRPWKGDVFEKLSSQEFWLRQNRQSDLFGTSTKDRKRPVVKVIVLIGETTIGQHPESAYKMVGSQKVLLIKKQSSIYVLKEPQLLPFIKDWMDFDTG